MANMLIKMKPTVFSTSKHPLKFYFQSKYPHLWTTKHSLYSEPFESFTVSHLENIIGLLLRRNKQLLEEYKFEQEDLIIDDFDVDLAIETSFDLYYYEYNQKLIDCARKEIQFKKDNNETPLDLNEVEKKFLEPFEFLHYVEVTETTIALYRDGDTIPLVFSRRDIYPNYAT